MVRSKTTVASIVTKNWLMPDLKRWEKMYRIPSQSFMRHAVTISTPASAASGSFAMMPPSKTRW